MSRRTTREGAQVVKVRLDRRDAIVWALLITHLVFLFAYHETLWRWTNYRFVYTRIDDLGVAGWQWESRWNEDKYGESMCWHIRTGRIAGRSESFDGDKPAILHTSWDLWGRIREQHYETAGSATVILKEPPWFPAHVDEAEDVAPWVAQGITVDDWWADVPGWLKQN